MSFLRPEIARGLTRWREVLLALAIIVLGLWIAWRPGPVVQGFGWVLMALGTLALIPAIRRARFTATGQGPGIVRVDEGRILYMGPITGGTVALAEMTALSLRRAGDGRAEWVMQEPGQLLSVPVDAAGAEALFDAFTALEGIRPPRLLAALNGTAPGTERVWTKPGAPVPAAALTR